MKEIINSKDVLNFLQDFRDNSIIEILEEGKERDEIFEIAEARGIKLKGSKDLAGLKLIYTFPDIANKNNARLPKKELLKALPTIVGKPLDVDHDRRYVIGSFIDYRYIVKDDMVVAYAVVYKSNFADEWETAKKLFKAGKLATSYEIWSDKNKRKELEDGTYELHDMTIAGGAILFKTKPAFEDAKVLEMAKTNLEQSEELVYASEYKDEDLMVAKDEMVATVPPTEAPKVEAPKVEPAPIVIPKIKCANCQHEFESPKVPTAEIKCSECFAIINEKGEILYPPQIIDFHISCPSCSSRNWRLLKREETSGKIKCLSCAKNYNIEFAKIESSANLDMIQFLHVGQVSCKQCGTTITYSGSSKMKKYNLKCSHCGLQFAHDITHEQIKKLIKIEEAVAEPAKASEEITSKADELNKDNSATKIEEAKGEVTVEKQEEKKVEEVKPVEAKVEETPKVETTPLAESVVAEAKPVEAKIEETPKVEEKKEEVKPEEAKVEETKPEEAPKIEEKPVEAQAETPVEEKKDEPAKAEEKPIEEAKTETAEEIKIKKYKAGILRLAKKIKEMRKEKASLAKASEDRVEFYKANAEEISKRRKEVGEFGTKLTDVEILEDAKFTDVKLEKANKELEASSIIGTKVHEHDDEWYNRKRKEISDKAEGKVKRNK